MIKYNNTNNASTTLTAGISASSTTLIVENGDILPTAPFLLTLEHFDNEKVTVREIVKCIAKAGNILTIQRGAGTCVQDDSASTKEQGNSAHSFSVGDCASIYWTSEQVQDIQNEIEKKLNIDDFQAGTYVYGATSTETDAYSITIPGTLTSYAVGQVFRFMADVDNEGNATLNINGLGAVEIRKNHDKILDNGDIEAGQIVEVAYDGTYFQMDSQVATVVSVVGMGNTQTMVIPAYETLQSKDGCTIIDTSTYNFGKNELGRLWDTVTSEIYGNGEESTNSFSIKIQRVGSDLSGTLHAQILDGEDVLYSTSVPRYEISDTVQDLTLNFGTIQLVYLKEYTLKLYTDSTDAENYYIINNQGNVTSQIIPINVVSDSVQNKRAKKIAAAGDIKGILVCQQPVQAKKEGVFEIGGVSSIFKDGTGALYQQTDGSITSTANDYGIGKFNELGLFKYFDYFKKTIYTSQSISLRTGYESWNETILDIKYRGYLSGTWSYSYGSSSNADERFELYINNIIIFNERRYANNGSLNIGTISCYPGDVVKMRVYNYGRDTSTFTGTLVYSDSINS